MSAPVNKLPTGALPDPDEPGVFFAFRKIKGGGLALNCGDYRPAGEDFQTSIKRKIASKFGPGHYEGTLNGVVPMFNDPKWSFKIGRDEAVAMGWLPDDAPAGMLVSVTDPGTPPRPVIEVRTDGEVVLGDPMDGEGLARLLKLQENHEQRIILALVNEVARLRQELERVKTRVT